MVIMHQTLICGKNVGITLFLRVRVLYIKENAMLRDARLFFGTPATWK